MPKIDARGLSLYYELDGPEGAPVIVLTRGLGSQIIEWPKALSQGLAGAGFRVLQYDNRDAGLSEKLGPCETPDSPPPAIYSVYDMAADLVGMLEALEIDRAHLFGISMGGMISQVAAADYPTRVRSLISVMSSAGEAHSIQGPKEAMNALFEPWPAMQDREGAIAKMARDAAIYGSPVFLKTAAEHRSEAEAVVARCYCPGGIARQRSAMENSGSRVHLLPQIRCPTLVIHGDRDPLIPLATGEKAARIIPGATMKCFAGMAHDLPGPLMPQMVEVVVAHCRKADAVGAA
ncbi:MAG: alpha/beta hydrolase [Pseudomonadota bacterium]